MCNDIPLFKNPQKHQQLSMLNREEYDKQDANLTPIATNQTLDGVVGKTGKDEKPN